jgi:hypothetical protein
MRQPPSLPRFDPRFQATWNEGLISSHGATLLCPQRGQVVGNVPGSMINCNDEEESM